MIKQTSNFCGIEGGMGGGGGEEGRKDTAEFINKGVGANIRHNDRVEAEVADPNDERLDFFY